MNTFWVRQSQSIKGYFLSKKKEYYSPFPSLLSLFKVKSNNFYQK